MRKLIFKFFSRYCVFLSLIIVTIAAVGCKPKINDSLSEVSSWPIEVHFCPSDDCGKALETYITNANSTVYCAFYELNLENVIKALYEKSKKIDVKIVTDSSTSNGKFKGEAVREDDDNQLMHNKFCVIDSKIVTTGSMNPTENDIFKNNNNLLILHSRILAGNYAGEFNELWNGKFGKGDKNKNYRFRLNNISIENYFCPEDSCAKKVADEIRKSRHSIYFMSFSFTSEEIGKAVMESKANDIRGIFDSVQAHSEYSQFDEMKAFGLSVKLDSNKYKLHHKVFILDNSTVITGSFNPTKSADTKNDENMLIIHDETIAKKFLAEFDRLWG